ncbi:MAG: prephenate dehydratase [Eggerthellaceae bacterium]
MNEQLKISYLGPQGTYSDEMAHRFASYLDGGNSTVFEPRHSFTGIFESVEAGSYGVIALENSLEGPVTAALDDFVLHPDVEIVAESVLDIHHCLMMRQDADPDTVKTITSHPQGLAQCRSFVKENFPQCNLIASASTAQSASMAAGDPAVAAIASPRAAEIYGLDIHMQNVADSPSDQTSFVLIAKKHRARIVNNPPTKTSLLLMMKENRAGVLLMVLEELAYANLNLTRIQSRPTKKALGEYLFFLDVDGTVDNPDLRTALDCLRLKLREVRVLGCYPII